MQSGYMLMILVSHGTFHARCVAKFSGDVKKVVYKKGMLCFVVERLT